MPIDVERVRADIPALNNSIYMNTGWAGPRPQSVTDAIRQRYEYEAQEGPGHTVAVITGKEMADKARSAVAKLIGVTPEELTFTQNTTEAINLVLSGLPLEEGDEVVTCDLEHPSVVVPCLYLQKRRGAVLKVVKVDPLDPKEEVLQKFRDAITSKTKLLCFSHVQYSCGLRMPVKELVQAAKQRGAYVLVDGAQAVGHIQMNVKELGCDFYAFPAHKWLLGPEGLGILYVRKEVLNQVDPLVIGEDALSAYDFTGKFIPNDRSMSKFTPSTQAPALYAGLTAAVEYIQSLGVADIQEKILEGAALLKNALPKVRGVKLLSHVNGEMASGIISFSMKGLEPSEVATGLWQHGRIVGRWVNYPACTRLCVGFFTSDRELNSTFGVLRRVADTAQSEETLEKVRKLF